MLISLQRTRENHVSTIGTLSGVGAVVSSLEDGYRDPKVQGETRIPAGRYDLKLRTKGGLHAKYLKRFGPDFHRGMIWLQDVPDFEYVYIHIGNEPRETEGCILVGLHVVAPVNSADPFKVTGSEKAYRLLYPLIRDAILDGECVLDIHGPAAPFVGV